MAKVAKGIRCTLNPDPLSFIYDWVKPFLNEEDYPIKELSGKTRYYVVVDGILYTDWDEDNLKERFGKDPETYTYIPATLDDNAELDKLDASYRKKLDSMPEAKRKQLLLGCWASTEDAGLYFRRESLIKVDKVPLGATTVRAWDLASSEITPTNKKPDATHGLKMSKCKDGYYYIHGSERFFKRVGDRDNEILKIANRDGSDVYIVTAIDPGAAGKTAYEWFAKGLIEQGFKVSSDVMPTTVSKLTKAEPFFSACENGLVRIVESSIEKEELDKFYLELELFNGERSTADRKDESVDTAAMAFNFLNKKKVYSVPKFTSVAAPSIKKQYDL